MAGEGACRWRAQVRAEGVNCSAAAWRVEMARSAKVAIEGPNIANAVKRTFWQMLFKFSFRPERSLRGHCADSRSGVGQLATVSRTT